MRDQRRERRDVGVDPGGPVDDRDALDDAGQLRAEVRATAPGTTSAIAAAHAGSVARSSAAVSEPGALRSRAAAMRLDLRPVDEALPRGRAPRAGPRR